MEGRTTRQNSRESLFGPHSHARSNTIFSAHTENPLSFIHPSADDRNSALFQSVANLSILYQIFAILGVIFSLVFYEAILKRFPMLAMFEPYLNLHGFGTMKILPERYENFMNEASVTERMVCFLYILGLVFFLMLTFQFREAIYHGDQRFKVEGSAKQNLATISMLMVEAVIVVNRSLEYAIEDASLNSISNFDMHYNILAELCVWWCIYALLPAMCSVFVGIVKNVCFGSLSVRRSLWRYRVFRILIGYTLWTTVSIPYLPRLARPGPEGFWIIVAQFLLGWVVIAHLHDNEVKHGKDKGNFGSLAYFQVLCRLCIPHALSLFMIVTLMVSTLVIGLLYCFVMLLMLVLLVPASIQSFATDFWFLLALALGASIGNYFNAIYIGVLTSIAVIATMTALAYIVPIVFLILSLPWYLITWKKLPSLGVPSFQQLRARFGESLEVCTLALVVGMCWWMTYSLFTSYCLSAVCSLGVLGAGVEHHEQLRIFGARLMEFD